MKKIILFACLIIAAFTSKAQQDVLLSQYMFNQLLVNPGYAGSKEYIQATALYRNQWAGWKDAPTTEVVTAHGPLGVSSLGWGGLVAHDHEGVTDRTDIYANCAYHIRVSDKFKLGMGLRGGGAYYAVHNSELKYWDTGDPLFINDKTTGFLPNLGAGLYLYGTRFYAGLSIPEVLSYDPTKSLSLSTAKIVPGQVRHYFITTGGVFDVSDDVIAKPSLMVKYVQNAPVEADFNVNFLFRNLIWLGASYRTGDAVVALLEIQINNQMRIGYSYDFTMTDIKSYSSGSHEIMLGYDFGFDIDKMKTPRYF